MDLFLTCDFAASRRLPRLPESHPCSRLHGHTFHVRLVLRGEVDAESGWLVDFGDVETQVEAIRGQLDHRYLNDVKGLENPTTERVAEWLWQRLEPQLAGLCEVTVQEHPARGVSYYGPA